MTVQQDGKLVTKRRVGRRKKVEPAGKDYLKLRVERLEEMREKRGHGSALRNKFPAPLECFHPDDLDERVAIEVKEFELLNKDFDHEFPDHQDRILTYSQRTHDRLNYFLMRVSIDSAVRGIRAEAIAEMLAERIVALEEKVAKAVPGMTYRGVHRDGETYRRGDVVTHHGSMWHANSETIERPGEGAKAWTLCVKKGRDAQQSGERR